jgi:hypothetical protein
MTNYDIKRICIHECSHAIVARLFRQRITMEALVVSTALVKNGQDLGTLHIRQYGLNDVQNYTALAITLLAGVVGENIYLLGPEVIKQKKEEVVANDRILDWLSGGGDIPSFEYNAFAFRIEYCIDEKKLKEFCLRFLIDFLSDKDIWYLVEKLCDEVLKKDDLKLSEEELESVFEQIGSDYLFDKKRDEYLVEFNEVLSLIQ